MQREQIAQDPAIGAGPQTIETLYKSHFDRLRQFLRLYLGNSAAAEDVAQDSFLELWRRPDNFNPDRSSLKAYLFGIARVRAANWRRKNKERPVSHTEPVVAAEGKTSLLQDALDRLDPDRRNLLWLREVEGHSYELAAIFGIPLGTVRSRLHTAREHLRRVWKVDV